MPTRDAFPAKHYHEDGNPEMYTNENMKKRGSLKDNEVVIEAIRNFANKEIKGYQSGKVMKEEYFRVFMNIGMILRPGLEPDKLQSIIKADYDVDCQDRVEKKGEEEEAKNQEEQQIP